MAYLMPRVSLSVARAWHTRRTAYCILPAAAASAAGLPGKACRLKHATDCQLSRLIKGA
jgi:hypothetical protein